MDMISENNALRLTGTLAGRPHFSHSSRGAEFWQFPLAVRRLSGTEDILNVVAKRELLEALSPEETEKLQILGELRSFNNRGGEGAQKLSLTGRLQSRDYIKLTEGGPVSRTAYEISAASIVPWEETKQ